MENKNNVPYSPNFAYFYFSKAYLALVKGAGSLEAATFPLLRRELVTLHGVPPANVLEC